MPPGNPLKAIKPLEHILTFVQTYCPYRERRTSWRSFSQDWPDNRAEPAEDSRERVSSPTARNSIKQPPTPARMLLQREETPCDLADMARMCRH